MTHVSANPLWVDLQTEIDRPDLWLQILVLCGCVVIGWLLSQRWVKKFSARHDQQDVLRVPFDSFQFVLTPLLIVVLMGLAAVVVGQDAGVDAVGQVYAAATR